MQIRTTDRTTAGLGLLAACLLMLQTAALAQSGDAAPADDSAAQASDDDKPPWFTGPLLVPGATMLGAGGILAQGYLYAGEGLGIYNNGLSARRAAVETTVNGQLLLGYGFTDRFETQLDLQFIWNSDSGASDGGAGDTQLELHYLVADEGEHGWLPAIRLDYIQVFPTGEFEQLDPAKNGTDALGSGTWAPTVALNFMKTFHLGGEYFLRPDLSILYSMPFDRDVHGLNIYGGGQGTDGTLHPGNAITGYLSGEFSFTRNWALGFDSTYTYVDSTSFSGNPGLNPDGTPATVGTNSSYQITLSPQLEYNFDSAQGIVLGPWFTLSGRNAEDFASFVISYATEFDTPPLF